MTSEEKVKRIYPNAVAQHQVAGWCVWGNHTSDGNGLAPMLSVPHIHKSWA